jgi:molybdate transport system ATP-binding protein
VTDLLTLSATLERRGGFSARFDLTTPLTGVTAILGPSGAGKSTLLRLIAGLEPDARLRLTLGNETWDDGDRQHLPAHRRSISLVFQDGRLFPHLSVAGNLEFPLRRRSRAGFRLSFDAVVELLALNGLLDRYPHTLSGGQRQRVALGRALLTPARLWLFDEPLAALDDAAKRDIAPYLERVCRDHQVPIFYVTHVLEEVVDLADTVLIVEHGRIVANQAIEALGGLLPIDETSRGGSVLRCRVIRYDEHYDLTELSLGSHPIFLRGRVAPAHADVRVLVPARDVSLATGPVTGMSVLNRLPCTIESLQDDAHGACIVSLACDGQRLLARITRFSKDELALAPGQAVVALVKTAALATLRS